MKNAWSALIRPSAGMNDEEVLEWLGIKGVSKNHMQEVTYYTCMKMLAETMGKLPLKYYQETKDGKIRADPTPESRLLTVRPNEYMTPSTFWWNKIVSITETVMCGCGEFLCGKSTGENIRHWIFGLCKAIRYFL